jgi:agmatine/peptidylarginine deiminase
MEDTIKSKIVAVLETIGKVSSNKEILVKYNETFTKVDINSIDSNLGWLKRGGKLIPYKKPGTKRPTYWGINAWFERGVLKEEYK